MAIENNKRIRALENIEFERKLYQSGVVSPPIGSIIAYFGGYFEMPTNGNFSIGIADENKIKNVNELLNPDGWYVCDGSMISDEEGPIFTKDGRYLPNLTDNRFIMGATAIGEVGGDNSMKHKHGLTASTSGNASVDHTHGGVTADSGNTGNQSVTHTHTYSKADQKASNHENRPQYLSVLYIMRIR